MKIVEFADYLCPHCKHAYPKLHSFVSTRKDVYLEFQAFPLDGKCNKDIPPGDGARCFLARVVQCGKAQNMGWKTQKWIFDNQRSLVGIDRARDQVGAMVAELELDKVKLDDCVESEATYKTIAEQSALGKKLGIRGTPALFVNGKKVQGITLPILKKLYKAL